jgi:hypothetical protein
MLAVEEFERLRFAEPRLGYTRAADLASSIEASKSRFE